MTAIVLIGAGHAHALALAALARRPIAGAQLTLISDRRRAAYSGMVPGLVAGHYREEEVHIDAAGLAARAGAAFIEDSAVTLDPDARTVRLASGRDIAFDIAAIDTGAPSWADLPGAEFALPVKPMASFLARIDAALASLSGAPANLTIVGAGAGGVELAFALRARLSAEAAAITLVTAAPDILDTMPPRARRLARRRLLQRSIAIRTGGAVCALREGVVLFADGAGLPSGLTLLATGAAAPKWLADAGLALDPHGFARIGASLQAIGRPHIFVSGDAASLDGHGLPKAGVHAVRQGPILAENLRRLAEGRPLKTYRPQSDMLVLLSTGDGRAIACRNGFAASGRILGWWKERIDRGFMRRFR